MHEIVHILEHSLEHLIGLVPLLFVVFLILEYIEHTVNGKILNLVHKSRRWGPLWGGVFGAFPQCGFSVFITNLFVGRVATLGTLVAVYLSTSDEMLPILLANQVDWKVCSAIVFTKIVVGVIVGFLVDIFVKQESFRQSEIHGMCGETKCRCETSSPFFSALIHTVKLTVLLFVTTVLLNGAIEIVGRDMLKEAITSIGILSVVISALIGFIPNCASSVILTQLFAEGAIPIGTLLAGLLTGAGLGWIVLIRYHKNRKQTAMIALFLFAIAVLIGSVTNIIIQT